MSGMWLASRELATPDSGIQCQRKMKMNLYSI